VLLQPLRFFCSNSDDDDDGDGGSRSRSRKRERKKRRATLESERRTTTTKTIVVDVYTKGSKLIACMHVFDRHNHDYEPLVLVHFNFFSFSRVLFRSLSFVASVSWLVSRHC
jgi:hypothetical protein